MSDQAAVVEVDDVIGAITETLEKSGKSPTGLSASTRLEELGLTSLELTDVFLLLEEAVGCELDPVMAQEAETVGDLAALRSV